MTDTQNSLHEHLFPFTTVMKQRVVDNFDAESLNERWSQTNFAGGGTVSMEDAINEGLKIVTNTTSLDAAQIDFASNARHYSHTASVVIGVMRLVVTNLQQTVVAFRGTTTGNDFAFAGCNTTDSTSLFVLRTADASTVTFTASSISLDTIFHTHKIELTSSNMLHTIDGVLETTKSTNRPTIKQQPVFLVQTRTSAARDGRIRYLEAYNI